jgi:hypothetical protein
MQAQVRRRWKSVERSLAKRLGGERVPVTGRTRGFAPDIRHELYAIEVKSRKTQYKLIAEALDQAEKAAAFYLEREEGKRIPIGLYHVTGEKLEDTYVFMRLGEFEEYFDPLLKAYRLAEEILAKTA